MGKMILLMGALIFLSASAVQASSASIHLQSGKAKIARNDVQGATEDYKIACDLEPSNRTALLAYATVLTSQQNLPLAKIYVDKYIGIAGKTDFIRFLQAAIYYYSKEYSLAIESFNEMDRNKLVKILAKPGVRQYFLLRGDSFLKLQRYSEALDDFNHVLEADPHHVTALALKDAAMTALNQP